MGRIFLSHSSANKDYVSVVANLLGKDNCIYDAYTFEAGMKNIDEIFKGLDRTDIFVYFISEEALNSKWVNKELNCAIEKLGNMSNKIRQIFPIIIDKTIEHSDSRIASYIKEGDNSYNLRHIENPKIAYRKIKSQMISLMMDNDLSYKNAMCFYFGKDDAKALFRKRYYDMSMGPVKCMILSGIDGIGRKSYINAVLKDVAIVEKYYFPMILTLTRDDGIEDLAVKLSLDLGLGNYRYEDIVGIKNINEKIEIVVELLNRAQLYGEHIIIEDDLCLLNQNGNLKYWFETILDKIQPKLVISIISRIVVDQMRYKKCRHIFMMAITELTSSETAGYLDVSSKMRGICFERSDIKALLPVLSGYPPQVEYCIDLALRDSVEFVKANSDEIRKMPEQISSRLLAFALEDDKLKEYRAFLRFLADFGVVPITLIYDIIQKNKLYEEIFFRLRSFSICYHTGSSREYVKLNPVIQNFVIRNDYELGVDINNTLRARALDFYDKVQEDDYIDLQSNSEIKYYLMRGIVEDEGSIPEKYLYSTIFLQSIIELYKKRRCIQIINIVGNLIEATTLQKYEEEIESRIRYYYCLALAREKSVLFDTQVEYFRKDPNKYVSYNFLKGFYYRISGNFEKAEQSFNNIINKVRYNDTKTLRELVYIYIVAEEYDQAEELARYNYLNTDKNNISTIQAYFECLVFKKKRTERDDSDIEEMMDIVKSVYLTIEMNSRYYQIMAKYEAFINRQTEKAVDIIEEGIEMNKKGVITYLLKDLFDIYENENDKINMKETYKRLLGVYESCEEKDKRLEAVIVMKKIILDAYMGVSKMQIKLEINRNRLLSRRSKESMIKKIDKILG